MSAGSGSGGESVPNRIRSAPKASTFALRATMLGEAVSTQIRRR